MTNKNIFLATIALTFAIGSAVASTFIEDQVYVKARRTKESDPTCICINKTCVQTTNTAKICWAQIELEGSGVQAACSTCTFKTYKSGCTVVLFDDLDRDQTNALPCEGTIYALVL